MRILRSGWPMPWALAVAAWIMSAGFASADDVNITTSTNDGVSLDGFAGTTVLIAPGITVDNTSLTANCPSFGSICASTQPWTLTNRGTIGPSGVRFSFGGALVNAGS